jgi:superfamily I DNA/RNA helicase
VTFTNKAAGEMKERLAALLGQKRCPPELIVSTFHSLCVRILRRDAERLGYRRGWTICDTGGQISIVRRALRHLAGARRMKPEEILQRISRLKCDGLSPRRYLTGAVEEDEETVGHVWRKYQEHLRATNTMDFDDLLVNAVAVLRQEEDARAHWQERAAHLIVDEFQDTSDVQFELLKLLAEPQRNLCVVGDDDQSIYAWRGARPRNIVHFEGHFPGARTVRLEENYRSINTVLQAANALIAQNEERPSSRRPTPRRRPSASSSGCTAPSRPARRPATTPSWCAPTSRPASSRRSCAPTACPTWSSAGRASTTARRSATCWPT